MGFSILIPVFNWDINQLIDELRNQSEEISDNFQILLIDDCSELSTSYLNKKVALKDNVEYHILSNNIGRSSIRNLLIEKARFEKCIFLDCDVSIIRKNFIAKYLENITEKNVVVGGHAYKPKQPVGTKKYLHWLYGTKKESKDAITRGEKPYSSFMSSNFACSKSIFGKIKFDESIQGYGHEDTLFGIQLEEEKVPILHIENPVQHNGLDDAKDFLRKQEQAVKNLKKLYRNSKSKAKLYKHCKLIRFAKIPFLYFLIFSFSSKFKKNLGNSEKPNLFFLQLLKIIWWNRS